MILKRHGRRFIMTHRSPSVPPPLPFQLVFSDELFSGDQGSAESEEWESVEDEELVFRAELPADSSVGHSSALMINDASEEEVQSGASFGDHASSSSGTRRWVQLAAVLALSAMAVAAAWLPVGRPWLPLGVSLARSHAAAPAGSVVYVVPVTIVGQAPGSERESGQELAAGKSQEE